MKSKGAGKTVRHSAKKVRVAKHREVTPFETGKKKLPPKTWER